MKKTKRKISETGNKRKEASVEKHKNFKPQSRKQNK